MSAAGASSSFGRSSGARNESGHHQSGIAAGDNPRLPQSNPNQIPAILENGAALERQSLEDGSNRTLARTPSQNSGTGRIEEPDPFTEPPDPNYDDRATQVARHLDSWDVLALVFNKMVGTGLFTTPGLVLALTQSSAVSIGLWAFGGLYTALSLLVYLEFGTSYPHNGGELIYLDRIWAPGLLFTIFFAGYQICFGNTAGNSIAFGKYIVVAAAAGDIDDIDTRLVKFVSICALTFACGVLFALPRIGMFLNKSLALFKVVVLLAVFAKGMEAYDGKTSALVNSTHDGTTNFRANMSAIVYIIYSYTGWENGNYVAGEIRDLSDSNGNSKLLRGAMGAVLLTTVLYVLVVVAYYGSSDYASIVGAWSTLGMGADFGPRAFGDRGRTFDILAGVSALGNLIAVVYTSAKIKQAIARQRLIPLWRWIEKDKNLDSTTPKGGLILHWITTTIWIAALPIDKNGYDFVIGISTYGRVIIETTVTIGIWVFYYKIWREKPVGKWRFLLFRRCWMRVVIPSILVAFNGIILVLSAMLERVNRESKAANAKSKLIPDYWWPAVIGMVFVGSLVYWGAMVLLQTELGQPKHRNNDSALQGRAKKSIALRHIEHSSEAGQVEARDTYDSNDSDERRTVGQWLGLPLKVYHWTDSGTDHDWPNTLDQAMHDAEAEGSLRRVDAQVTIHPPEWLKNTSRMTLRWIVRYLF